MAPNPVHEVLRSRELITESRELRARSQKAWDDICALMKNQRCDAKPSPKPSRRRLDALLRAYVRNEEIVQGQPITRAAIIEEIRAIAALRDVAKATNADDNADKPDKPSS